MFRMPEDVYFAELSKSFYLICSNVKKPLHIEKSELTVKSLLKAMSDFSIKSDAVEAKDKYTSICPEHFWNNNATMNIEYIPSQTKYVRKKECNTGITAKKDM